MTRVTLLAAASAVTMVLALSLAAAPIPPPFHQVSGYEFLLGNPCTIGPMQLQGKCGVSFLGWIGGKGSVPNGWMAYPGNTQGLWQATVNYIGLPDFGATVTVAGGGLELFFKHYPGVLAKVTGGTVTWPDNATTDIGCGPGVATVNLTLSSGQGGPTSFDGCLHDLPAGSIIPPKIWGSLQ